MPAPAAITPPTLVYDGDCAVCRYWVNYWQELTGGRVVYRPYQNAAADFPAISPGDFRRAIQFIEPGAQVYSGAAATSRGLVVVLCTSRRICRDH
jgi:predicted DCC family thiol-disulfide oxidoreductase YuxK